MKYLERILTFEDLRYQFRIFKVVNMLYKVGAISYEEHNKHMFAIELSRPVGLQIFYDTCQYKEMNGQIIDI